MTVRCTEAPEGCPDPGRTPKCSDCRRFTDGPLLIEGNLSVAAISVEGQTAMRDTVRALVTGGRTLLPRMERAWFRTVGGEDSVLVFGVKLLPEVERKLRINGGHLSDDEILAGIAQIFPGFTRDDVVRMAQEQTATAYADGCTYTMNQMQQAVFHGDERALHRAYETARKTMALRKRLGMEGTTGPSVEGQSAPGRSPGTNTTGEEQR
jgi:hypothetical protein